MCPSLHFEQILFFQHVVATFPLIIIIIISGEGADSNEKEKKGHSEDLKKTKLN